jgi:hypothetical protein
MNTDINQIATELAAKDFNLELVPSTEAREVLADRIADLMANNPILLKSIFYRIDLNESLLGMALVSMEGRALHLELADQVLERMRKKAEWRLKTSQRNLD